MKANGRKVLLSVFAAILFLGVPKGGAVAQTQLAIDPDALCAQEGLLPGSQDFTQCVTIYQRVSSIDHAQDLRQKAKQLACLEDIFKRTGQTEFTDQERDACASDG